MNPGAQGRGGDAELGGDIGVGTVARHRLDHGMPMVGRDAGQGMPQLGAQDQPADVVEAARGAGAIALYERAGYRRAPEFDFDMAARYSRFGAAPIMSIAYLRHLAPMRACA